jgi:CarboxypepD_reg-like domain
MKESGIRRRRVQKVVIGIIILISLSFSSFAQRQIKGIVIDSASFGALPNVNIQLKNSVRGTISNVRGEFRVTVTSKDTVVLSLVGYRSEEFAAAELDVTVILRMVEEVRVLQTVTIFPGKEIKPVRALHLAPKQGMGNFGPTGAGVNFGYFTKEQKERRKLRSVLAEHDRVKNYIAVVCSPEVRERIMADYALTEDRYYQILAQFNVETGDTYYNLTSEELIVVLNEYYDRNAGKVRR